MIQMNTVETRDLNWGSRGRYYIASRGPCLYDGPIVLYLVVEGRLVQLGSDKNKGVLEEI